MRGELLCVDRARRTVTLSPTDGGDGACRVVGYDKLVLALGAVSHFHGVPGAAEHALTLDDVSDAETFRRRLIAACVHAAEHAAPARLLIVGGGATGVELAAALGQGAGAMAELRITVIERGPRLLPQLHPQQSASAARHLRALGVTMLTSTAVAGVSADAVFDDAGHAHRADLTLWTAGVAAPPLCATLGLAVNQLNQLVVDAGLCSVSDAGIYAFGDCASHVCPVQGAAPPRAQVAHQQAMFLADLLAGRRQDATPPGFRYHDHGTLVSLGAQAS
jgi:NADH dehydrogenase